MHSSNKRSDVANSVSNKINLNPYRLGKNISVNKRKAFTA